MPGAGSIRCSCRRREAPQIGPPRRVRLVPAPVVEPGRPPRPCQRRTCVCAGSETYPLPLHCRGRLARAAESRARWRRASGAHRTCPGARRRPGDRILRHPERRLFLRACGKPWQAVRPPDRPPLFLHACGKTTGALCQVADARRVYPRVDGSGDTPSGRASLSPRAAEPLVLSMPVEERPIAHKRAPEPWRSIAARAANLGGAAPSDLSGAGFCACGGDPCRCQIGSGPVQVPIHASTRSSQEGRLDSSSAARGGIPEPRHRRVRLHGLSRMEGDFGLGDDSAADMAFQSTPRMEGDKRHFAPHPNVTFHSTLPHGGDRAGRGR